MQRLHGQLHGVQGLQQRLRRWMHHSLFRDLYRLPRELCGLYRLRGLQRGLQHRLQRRVQRMRRMFRVRRYLLRWLWKQLCRMQFLCRMWKRLLRRVFRQLWGLLGLFGLRRLLRVFRLFFRVLRTVQGLLLHRLHGHLHGDLRGPVLRFGYQHIRVCKQRRLLPCCFYFKNRFDIYKI